MQLARSARTARRTAGGLLVVALASIPALLRAQAPSEFRVVRAAVPPNMDGDLSDDAVWANTPLALGEWVTYNPLRGERGAPLTEVRVAYDDRYLYFAFHCFDDEPAKIRTTVSKRDTVFNDDWVGLSLDSAGTGQTSYHLFVNPSGVQMDALNTTASNEQFDADFVWDSTGKITADGYVVKVRVPLQSIRFRGGQNVRMGILFWRHVSRSGKSYSWPDLPPGQWVFDRHAHLIFDVLEPRRLREVLPSVTFPINQTRASAAAWNGTSATANVGFSAKYGVTPNVTVDATVHPDFSQVESDAFQVQANQRFPIFYGEKRPFFMEGMGLFNIAGTGGDGNMRTAVHTRHIISPTWGAKLTGTAGSTTFGILTASDSTPELSDNNSLNVPDRHKLFTIGRATYALGGPNYVGALVTETAQPGRTNQVIGGDVSLRVNHQQLSATFLKSATNADAAPEGHGSAAQASYSVHTHRATLESQLEHYDRDFQMDTAFYNQTGFTSGWVFSSVDFYPSPQNRLGLQHAFPFVYTSYVHDRIQGGNGNTNNAGVRFNFTRQGFLNVSYQWGQEPWAGQEWSWGGGLNTYGNVQLFRWLNVNGNFRNGDQVFYDRDAPYQGRSTSAGLGLTLQPNEHVSQDVQYDSVRFDRASTGERVFTVNIVNTRTTYQFNRHFLIRLLEQFDSSRSQLLTDLLASYELVPGTVVHAGYGSIFERAAFENGLPVPDAGNYLTVSRGLFFKVSYLRRF